MVYSSIQVKDRRVPVRCATLLACIHTARSRITSPELYRTGDSAGSAPATIFTFELRPSVLNYPDARPSGSVSSPTPSGAPCTPGIANLAITGSCVSLSGRGSSFRRRRRFQPFRDAATPRHAGARGKRMVCSRKLFRVSRIARHETLPCLQMVLPRTISPPDSPVAVVPLSRANADEMVVLTSLAFPGFFRRRTCEMGSYFGIRSDAGELLAMGGERLKLDGFTEISASARIHRSAGEGTPRGSYWEVVRKHRLEGITSFLHVSASNSSAIRLYRHMGFETTRIVTLHRISPKS